MMSQVIGDAVGFACLVFQSQVSEVYISIIFTKTQVAYVIIPQLW